MSTFYMVLEARSPANNVWRSYVIDAGRDLLGDWVVETTFGRIHSRGRTTRHACPDEQTAQKLVRHCLKRRGSSPRRIGVRYEIIELKDAGHWLDAAMGR